MHIMNRRIKFRNIFFYVGLSLVFLLGTGFGDISAQENRPVGTWKDYFPYGVVLEVVAGVDEDGASIAFARTEYAVFKVESSTNLTTRISQIQGLSQSNPTAMSWYGPSEILIVGYADGNIDLVSNGATYNMPDIISSSLIGDKGIRKILVFDDGAYLACGFGVVVLDLVKFEVRDTWFVTGSQDLREVMDVCLVGDKWVVATDAGVFEAPVNHQFLSGADAWTRWEDLPEAPDHYTSDIERFGEDILVTLSSGATSRLWIMRADGTSEIFPGWALEGEELWGLDVASDTLVLGRCCGVDLYDSEYNPVPENNEFGDWMQVRDVAFDVTGPGVVWIASRIGGLLRYVSDPESGLENGVFEPTGPATADVRKIDCWNSNLWLATGGVDASWVPNYNSEGIHGFVDGDWINVDEVEGENDISGIRDYMAVSIDPLNPKHVMFGSFEEGLIEVIDGEIVEIWNESNSTIQQGDFGGSPRTGVSGVDFDKFGNLWFTNFFSNNPLQVRLADGTFVAMDLGDDLTSSDNVGELMVTRDGYVWVILPRGGGLLVLDPNGTPANTSDDDWRFLNIDADHGALPSNYIYSLEEDLDGEIWIGTASGPAIFYRSAALFENDYETTASQILIQQDGNYQYLLETEEVTSIKIDGGNRKWLGTSGSGIYVLSDDGLTIELQLSTENSPLPSENIQDIAINQASGEVFIATTRGIISYLGEATNWDSKMENMFVFPNPVDAYHEGPITIDGLAFDSTVHVTDASGRVIAVVESMGGRAVWDGRLSDGALAPYGVYLIFATNADGKTSATTKLAITR